MRRHVLALGVAMLASPACMLEDDPLFGVSASGSSTNAATDDVADDDSAGATEAGVTDPSSTGESSADAETTDAIDGVHRCVALRELRLLRRRELVGHLRRNDVR